MIGIGQQFHSIAQQWFEKTKTIEIQKSLVCFIEQYIELVKIFITSDFNGGKLRQIDSIVFNLIETLTTSENETHTKSCLNVDITGPHGGYEMVLLDSINV